MEACIGVCVWWRDKAKEPWAAVGGKEAAINSPFLCVSSHLTFLKLESVLSLRCCYHLICVNVEFKFFFFLIR